MVTRNGRPVFDLVPHKKRGGVDLAAGQAFLAEHGYTRPLVAIVPDFDEPLDEAFLISPLPPVSAVGTFSRAAWHYRLRKRGESLGNYDQDAVGEA